LNARPLRPKRRIIPS